MQNGISIYPGLDNTLAENLQLIEEASKAGLSRIFTSFHIPETDFSSFKKEIGEILATARKHDMEIISDISPKTLELLGISHFSLSSLQFLGIHTIRLDYGYTTEDIAAFSRNTSHICIQLNASTITPPILNRLIQAKADFNHINALHNFYPREGTGLSEETLIRKTKLLHQAGISVGAFVPSQGRRRSPLRRGLPTLEMHRDLPLDLAARHLAAAGMDFLLCSDSLPTPHEIHCLAAASNEQVTLRAKLLTHDQLQHDLLTATFTSRIDEARDAVRAQESRPMLQSQNGTIHPENTTARPYGAITLDNERYGRYMGELQIIKRPQPADQRTNVAAFIPEDEHFLINYIIPGKAFNFICSGENVQEQEQAKPHR
jgi:hypothetical protein